jgi:hypothetical protein
MAKDERMELSKFEFRKIWYNICSKYLLNIGKNSSKNLFLSENGKDLLSFALVPTILNLSIDFL